MLTIIINEKLQIHMNKMYADNTFYIPNYPTTCRLQHYSSFFYGWV